MYLSKQFEARFLANFAFCFGFQAVSDLPTRPEAAAASGGENERGLYNENNYFGGNGRSAGGDRDLGAKADASQANDA
jgi:hypothetical protein